MALLVMVGSNDFNNETPPATAGVAMDVPLLNPYRLLEAEFDGIVEMIFDPGPRTS